MKKLLTMLLCLMLGMMLAVLPAAAEQPAAEYPVDFSEEPYEVHIIMTVQAQVPTQEGIDRVVAELNKLTLRDLNMTVKLEIMDFSQYSQNVPLAMASREKIDLVALPFNYIISMGGAGYIYNLNPYLETYGKNIIGTYTSETLARVCTLNGGLYGVPVHKENCNQFVIVFPTAVLERNNIDPSEITDIETMKAAFEKLAANEPGKWVTGTGKDFGGMFDLYDFSIAGGAYGPCLMNMAESPKVENYFASPEYAEYVKTLREWYNKGWVNPGAATDDQYFMAVFTGQTLSFVFNYNHPLSKPELTQALGQDVTIIPLSDQYATTESSAAWNYCIPIGSTQPEKAMMMLDYLMTQKDAENLLNWGVEGEDYVVKGDVLDYPEGKDISTVSYHFGQGWILPNQFVCTPWINEGADIYERVIEYNKNAKESLALGFVLETSSILTEIAALNNIRDEYVNALNAGAVDPEVYLPMFLQAQEEAGMQKVIDEIQRQLDAFIASKQ